MLRCQRAYQVNLSGKVTGYFSLGAPATGIRWPVSREPIAP